MKTTIKFLFIFVFLAVYSVGYGQTPVADGKIADTATALAVNIPVGMKIATISGTQTLWICKVACPSGKHIGDKNGTGSPYYFTQIPLGAALTTTLTNTHVFVGNGSNVATDVAISGDATLANTGALTIGNNAITYAKMQAMTTGKILGSGSGTAVAEMSPTNGVQLSGSNLQADTAWAGMMGRTRASHELVSKTLTSGNILVGNSSNVATSVTMSSDATISNTGALTIAAAAVTLAKQANLAANSIIGNNTGSSATPIALTAANVRDLITANNSQENFEAAHDSTSHYIVTLASTPQSIGVVSVTLNGMVLSNTTPYAQYTLVETKKIRITVPVYTYDKISIRYNY